MEITILDVAKHAGVSTSTITNVLHNRPNVGSETRKRVQQVINELGYIPNKFAQGLKEGRSVIGGRKLTNNIGCVIFKGYNKFRDLSSAAVMESIESESRLNDYHVYFFNSVDELKKNDKLFNKLINDDNIDGLITIATQLEGIGETIKKRIKNIVSVSEPLGDNNEYDCILFDDYSASYDAVRYLAGLGHKRIASIISSDRAQRLLGYRQAVSDFKLDKDENLLEVIGLNPGTFSNDIDYSGFGFRLTKKILAQSPRPSAILVSDAEACSGVIKAISESGLKVPDDISIITIGSSDLIGDVSPDITTMIVNKPEVGSLAVRRLLERIKTPAMLESIKISVPFRILERKSTMRIPR